MAGCADRSLGCPGVPGRRLDGEANLEDQFTIGAIESPQAGRYYFAQMVKRKIRAHFGGYLAHAEVASYSILGVLLFITALASIANAGKMLWDGLGHWQIAEQTLRVLDQLLVVLMLVEILHTVRTSIRSHFLVTEPFLVVGLIASIRRILVITLEAANITKAEFCRECEYISSQHG